MIDNDFRRKITWKCLGELNISHYENISGVYVFIYNNSRIIYIGEAVSPITRRIGKHRNHIRSGGFSIFKASDNEDIYHLMTYKGIKSTAPIKLENYYKTKVQDEEIWIPSNKKKNKLWTAMYSDEIFGDNWQSFVKDKYLTNIEVYVAELKKDEKLLKCLESQLQSIVRKQFEIGYYKKHTQFSWIGKQEITDEEDLKKFVFDFNNFPVLGDFDMNKKYREIFINKS